MIFENSSPKGTFAVNKFLIKLCCIRAMKFPVGNRLQYHVPAQVGEPDAFWKHGKSTRAKIHSIAKTACTCPKSTGP